MTRSAFCMTTQITSWTEQPSCLALSSAMGKPAPQQNHVLSHLAHIPAYAQMLWGAGRPLQSCSPSAPALLSTNGSLSKSLGSIAAGSLVVLLWLCSCALYWTSSARPQMTRCMPLAYRRCAASRASCSNGPKSAKPWSTCPTYSRATQTSLPVPPRFLAWPSPPCHPLLIQQITATLPFSQPRTKGRKLALPFLVTAVMGTVLMARVEACQMGRGICMEMACRRMRWCRSHMRLQGRVSSQARRSAPLPRSTIFCYLPVCLICLTVHFALPPQLGHCKLTVQMPCTQPSPSVSLIPSAHTHTPCVTAIFASLRKPPHAMHVNASAATGMHVSVSWPLQSP